MMAEKDFEVKVGPAGVGYRQHDGYVVLVQGAYRGKDGKLHRHARTDDKLAYPVFFELPNAVAELEGIRAKDNKAAAPEAKK